MADSKPAAPRDTDKRSQKTSSKNDALSVNDLDQVSGGINPQPLPPAQKGRAAQ